MENLDDYFALAVGGEGITEGNLLDSLRHVVRIQLQNIDDIVSAARTGSPNLQDAISDAKYGLAYGIQTALSVGQAAYRNKIMRMIGENSEN